MLLATILSLLLLIPLALQLQTEAQRRNVSQLDRTNVTFYAPKDWAAIPELSGLEVLPNALVTETEFGTTVVYEVVNHGRLEGKREVWAKLYSQEGHLREGMKIWLTLKPTGRGQLEFFFTGTEAEFKDSLIELGF